MLLGILSNIPICVHSQTQTKDKTYFINIGTQSSSVQLISKSITNKTSFLNFGIGFEFYPKVDSSNVPQRLLLELNFSNRKYKETQTNFPFYRDEINANTAFYKTNYTENLLSYDMTQLFEFLNKKKLRLFIGIGGSLQFPVSSNGMRIVTYEDGSELELDKLSFYINLGIGGLLRLNYEVNRFNVFSDFRGYYFLTSNHQRYGKVVFDRDIDNTHIGLRINLGMSYRLFKY